jgi:hypothetical protein
MSLLDKASLILTPNAYKASKLYSIIPSNGNGDMTVVRNTSATRDNSSGLVELVGNNVPRLEYEASGSCPTILLEPQRTNLALYSEQFENSLWVKVGSATISQNTTISPDGTLDADTLSNADGLAWSSGNVLQGAFPTLALTTYTFSIYVKSLGSTTFSIGLRNQSTGIIVSSNIVPTSNWQRISVTQTTTVNTSIGLLIGNTNGNVAIWGAQLEVGAYITSYIPTTTTALTRNADVISKTGISDLIGQTEGTIYAEIKVNKLIGTASRYIFHISDGTANNRIYIAFSGSSSNVLRGRIFNGGTLQCSIDTSTITTTGTYKLALAYKNNDIVFYVNGVQIGVDTSATIPTCSIVDIGHNYAGASQLSDGISNANIFKTRLTNTELQSLTTL